MHIIDNQRFEKALKENGYATIGELAKDLGIHRNTIHHYLSGESVFPSSLEKIFQRLKLRPEEILVQTEESHQGGVEPIASLVDLLQKICSSAAFVLFGSRAKEKSKKYSDWDIGLFCTEGLDHKLYRKMRQAKEEFEESTPYMIDLVNLNRADNEFLKTARRRWQFLGGSLKSWLALNKKGAQ